MINIRPFAYSFFLSLMACSPGATMDALPDAKTLAETVINNFNPESFDQTYQHYSEDFWANMPQETWSKILPNLYKKLGPIESCELVNWSQHTSASTEGSGNFVHLQYHCIHSKYESDITFIVHKPLSGGESSVVGQNISSLGLLLE